MRIGSLCSGYEGLGMAVQSVLGDELAWVADNDPGASAILAHRFPSVPNLGDITAVDWSAVKPVDILCAGTPCQDVSQAGARAGLKAGTRSGVWLEAVRVIAALQPRLVLIENVRGLLSARGDDPTAEHLRAEAARDVTARLLDWLENAQAIALAKGDVRRVRECRKRTARVMGLRKRAVARCQWHERRLVRAIGTVLGSLADLGYDAEWVCVGADDAGACHERKRVFILAWPAADAGSERRNGWPGVGGHGRAASIWQQAGDHRGNGSGAPHADAASDRLEGFGQQARGTDTARGGGEAGAGTVRGSAPAEDPDRATGGQRRQPAPGQAAGWWPRADAGGSGGASAIADADVEHLRSHGRAAHGDARVDRTDDAESARGRGATPADAERGGRDGRPPLQVRGQAERAPAPGDSRVPDISWGAYELAIRRWERATGRPAPRPTEPGRTGERLSPRFVEWMMGLPEGWVTDVPGLSRNAQLKALGNGVVPAQAAMALRLLLERSGLLPLVVADLPPAEGGEAA